MKRGKRHMFLIAGMLAVAAIVAMGLISYHLKERKAVQIAQEYLAQKYEQEMRYEQVWYSWIDPGLYHVLFKSVNTEVYFEVQMWPEALKLGEGTTDERYIWDDYIGTFFCRKTEEAILPEIKKIWNEDVEVKVVRSNSRDYPTRRTGETNEHMTAIEMEPLYNYEIYITTNKLLNDETNDETKLDEALRIIKTMQYLKNNQYWPKEILFWFQTGKSEKEEAIKSSKDWAEYYIWFAEKGAPHRTGDFENWYDINEIDEVIDVINSQRAEWFDE